MVAIGVQELDGKVRVATVPRRDDDEAVPQLDRLGKVIAFPSKPWLVLSQRGYGQNAHNGIDAPICQDSRSRSQVCGLARSVVCHHALKNLAGENAFETADDLPFGPPFSGASFDVVEGW